jgi:uncharacterized protein YegJ (DUF2314 family)
MLALAGAMPAGAQEPPVISVPKGDPEMAAAIARGRATLDRFWQALERPAPDETGFALKVGFPSDNGGREHIWTDRIERRNGKIFGTINNVPQALSGIRLGQRIEIPEHLVSDWMFVRSDKIVGAHTVRVLLDRMPPKEADALRARMADPD